MKKPPNGGLFATFADRGLRGFGSLGGPAALVEACAQVFAHFV